MTDLQELTNKIIAFRKKRGWVKGKAVAPKNMAIALVLEAAEFLEVFEWTEDNDLPEERRQHMEEELVDVLYWVLTIAHDFKIDLPKAFARKMKKNKSKYPVGKPFANCKKSKVI
jgi:NTP pyrophosphatase (non-canonical NTP hydrolase)